MEQNRKLRNRSTHAEICYMTARSLETSGEKREQTINGAKTGDYSYVGIVKLDLFYSIPHKKSIPDGLKTNAKENKKLSGRQYKEIFL